MNNSVLMPAGPRGTVAARRAATGDIGAISSTLAAAFFNDPVFEWCYPDAARRHRTLQPWFEAVTSSYLPHQHVYTTDDQIAAAVWLPAGAPDDEQLGDRLLEISGEDRDRLALAFELMEANHPRQPHHYLFLLGTRPERQGQGFGSSLLRPVLAMADRDGLPAYLEATSENNRNLYLRHGFETCGEIPLPGGPSLWSMWREPATSVA